MAQILNGAWRIPSPRTPISAEEVETAAPPLLGSGAGGLGWAALSHFAGEPAYAAPLSELRSAFRYHTIHAAYNENEIRKVMRTFRQEGIEPVLVKGWAVARMYPSKGMRPYGDIDLCVCEDEYEHALALTKPGDIQINPVDLHKGTDGLNGVTFLDLFNRSRLVPLGDVQVRVPSQEDLLRIVSLHALRHSLWRPLWLCDVAVLLESAGSDFNWALCIGESEPEAGQVLSTFVLAQRLLGARLDEVSIGGLMASIPRWLEATVLKLWHAPYVWRHSPIHTIRPMRSYLRRPRGLLQALRARWPNPIAATYNLHQPLNRWPRLPYQVAEYFRRTARLLIRAR